MNLDDRIFSRCGTVFMRCGALVPAPFLPPLADGRIPMRECGAEVEIPVSQEPTAGFPVVSFHPKCPACGAELPLVQDFGRCDGISKVKKFPFIVAGQRKALNAARKLGVAS